MDELPILDYIDNTTCRICLEDGAIYPIFESNEEFESVYTKLALCIREKLENIVGYPSNICIKCKNTSETICNFIAKFEKSCEILKNKIVQVKIENLEDFLDTSDNETEVEPFIYELQMENDVKPKPEKRDPTELLESLAHLTVKRIKVENCEETCTENEDKNKSRSGQSNKAVTKKGRSKKAVAKPAGAKKAVAKTAPAKESIENRAKTKKAVAKLITARNNGASKQSSTDPSQPGTKVDEKNNRLVNLNKKLETEEKPISKDVLCDHCGATFSEKKNLQIHILKAHLERKFKCTKCPKAYYREWDLNSHQKRHDNVRPHVCETCGKGFYERKMLNGHIRYVHKRIRKKHTYKCKFCDTVYKCRRSVVVHERSVHTGERPEVCQICGGSFYDVVYLREHMRIHTGETPFKCPVCARGYTQIGNMKSHMRNHNISKLDPETLAKIKPSHLKFMRP